MKALITFALLLGIYMLGKTIYEQAKVKQAKEEAAARGEPLVQTQTLPGMPPQFEASLQNAQAQGAPALAAWLNQYRAHIRDPRLAAIELDYVVLVSRSNPNEAKRVFQSVKARTPASSPVYDRVKRLEPTYGQ